jgi:hypothetical protein
MNATELRSVGLSFDILNLATVVGVAAAAWGGRWVGRREARTTLIRLRGLAIIAPPRAAPAAPGAPGTETICPARHLVVPTPVRILYLLSGLGSRGPRRSRRFPGGARIARPRVAGGWRRRRRGSRGRPGGRARALPWVKCRWGREVPGVRGRGRGVAVRRKEVAGPLVNRLLRSRPVAYYAQPAQCTLMQAKGFAQLRVRASCLYPLPPPRPTPAVPRSRPSSSRPPLPYRKGRTRTRVESESPRPPRRAFPSSRILFIRKLS